MLINRPSIRRFFAIVGLSLATSAYVVSCVPDVANAQIINPSQPATGVPVAGTGISVAGQTVSVNYGVANSPFTGNLSAAAITGTTSVSTPSLSASAVAVSGTSTLATVNTSGTTTNTGATVLTGTVSGAGIDAYTVQAGGPVNVKLYGAKCDGATNDTTAINNALAGSSNIIFTGTCIVNGALTVPSNRTITLAGGSAVVSSAVNANVFNVNGSSNVTFFGPGKIQNTATTTNTAYIADISASGSSHVKVYGVELQGGPWAAFYADACNDCSIINSYIHDTLSNVQDTSCIMVYENSNNVVISGNTLTNCGHVGVFVQGPASGLFPINTVVQGNNINGAEDYGIITYQSGAFTNNFNARLIGNNISNIDGGVSFTGSISGTTLTVATVPAGQTVMVQSLITGAGVTANTQVTAIASGTGGPGSTYTLSQSSSVGTIALVGSSPKGAGIYIQNAGAVTASDNQISYVAQRSFGNTLTPAGIGVNNITAGIYPPVLSGNTITNVGYTPALVANSNVLNISSINVSSSTMGAVINGTTIVEPTGMANPSYYGVYINASSNVVVDGLTENIANTLPASIGVTIFANGVGISNINLSNISVTGTANAGIRSVQVGGFVASNVSISNYTFSGGATTASGMQLDSLTNATINGANVTATTQSAGIFTNVLSTRVSNSNWITSGTVAVSTSGTCTGSFMDVSNYWGTNPALMSNTCTGFNVEWRTNGVPTAGNWVQGDRARQSVYVAGSPVGWARITTGTGNVLGTDWKAEANL